MSYPFRAQIMVASGTLLLGITHASLCSSQSYESSQGSVSCMLKSKMKTKTKPLSLLFSFMSAFFFPILTPLICVYCSQSYMGSLLVADVRYWHISIHAQPTFTDATKISKYSWNPNIDNFYREV